MRATCSPARARAFRPEMFALGVTRAGAVATEPLRVRPIAKRLALLSAPTDAVPDAGMRLRRLLDFHKTNPEVIPFALRDTMREEEAEHQALKQTEFLERNLRIAAENIEIYATFDHGSPVLSLPDEDVTGRVWLAARSAKHSAYQDAVKRAELWFRALCDECAATSLAGKPGRHGFSVAAQVRWSTFKAIKRQLRFASERYAPPAGLVRPPLLTGPWPLFTTLQAAPHP